MFATESKHQCGGIKLSLAPGHLKSPDALLNQVPTTLSGPQIVGNVVLSNADFNEERTNRRNAPNTADFNRSCASEFSQENNFRSKKLEGGTKSKVERLISQFQEFAKVSSNKVDKVEQFVLQFCLLQTVWNWRFLVNFNFACVMSIGLVETE